MTTEIAILNKSAVALATDSAVTISVAGEGIAKIYVDANKLFEPVRSAPVALMIYNSAQVAGVPWETLIKLFRKERGNVRTDRLEDYARSLLEFVQTRLSRVVDGPAQLGYACSLVHNLIQAVVRSADENLTGIKSKVERRKRFVSLLDNLESRWHSLPVMPWAESVDETALATKVLAGVGSHVPDQVAGASISIALRRRIVKVILAAVLRSQTEIPGVWTGMVVAGFGESELYPSLFHARVGGLVENRLFVTDEQLDTITDDIPAIIRPYAQTSEAIMFLQGIDPAVSSAITSFWEGWAGELRSNVVRIARDTLGGDDLTSDQMNALSSTLDSFTASSWSSFADYMEEQFHRKRMEPIEASASFLSKREIAELAENLVDLTSLRDRVSLDRQETVGGATDVAVISPGDGFVWVRRKHYFERDRNPTWALRQALTDVTSSLLGGRVGTGGVTDAGTIGV